MNGVFAFACCIFENGRKMIGGGVNVNFLPKEMEEPCGWDHAPPNFNIFRILSGPIDYEIVDATAIFSIHREIPARCDKAKYFL